MEEENNHHNHHLEYYSCLPQWLETLLDEKFFTPCLIHEDTRKNEKNVFCLDCCTSFCPHCFSSHCNHRLLRIRRYIYHDVMRLDDVQQLIDCSQIQSYTTNAAKVIFLNQRPITRTFRVSGNVCISCDRSLRERYLFCSLNCKVQHLIRLEGGVSRYLYQCDFLPLSSEGGGKGDDDEFDFDFEKNNGQMTPDSILVSPVSYSGGSSASGNGIDCRTLLLSTATTEFVRKKRSSKTNSSSSNQYHHRQTCCSSPEIAAMNRRKGIPQRAPLY
ncbi:hypothetical protein MKW94_003118 [Papaver nudicaule]|uniref:B box-type domain-containing protein n=1 Tax=Papaver nudicaule TaxID=74823 RepID=A0AA41VKL0_PAPNU|nr:hypothetical protein [Papaver nudicaule]